jgi:5-formyltetrahydrofolate cyclo-ligase
MTPTGPRAKRDTRQTLSATRDAMPPSDRATASLRVAATVDRILGALPAGNPGSNPVRAAARPQSKTLAGVAPVAASAPAPSAAPGPVPTLALYAAKGSEVDTTAIDVAARARGWRVVYPRVIAGQRALAFHLATPTELVAATFGLREPVASAPTVSLAELTVICVPGLAFDRGGGRLGWGHGFYDATLAQLGAPRPLLLGLAFECQIINELPREAHDVLLDRVITEATT